ncbi:MAG: putative lipid II flippase FtsW [bacterium]|nr:putative lipid II flippase FtsW [bacterium]
MLRRKSKLTNYPLHRPDYIIGLLVLLLIGVGMIIIYSIGSIVKFNVSGGRLDQNTFFTTQLISLFLGAIVWFIASKINYRFWQKISIYLAVVSLILMLLVMLPPLSLDAKGATRWLKLGPLSFQPVEFFKLSLIILLANLLDKGKEKLKSPLYSLLPFMIILTVIAALVVLLQKDMGSAMVLVAICFSMYFTAGTPFWQFLGSFTAVVAGGIILILTEPYRFARVNTFFSRGQDLSGTGYHINQALIALGSGGLIGRGLGKSLQAYGYLPESINDSIFAIIGEQFGLVGTLSVIVLFVLLIYRFLKICLSAPDMFSRMLAVGITVWIGIQTLTNIAAMLGLIPLTGIPLPMISYGGTSMIFLLFAIGIMQNISKYTIKEGRYANNSFRRGDRGSYFAGSSYARRVKKTG